MLSWRLLDLGVINPRSYIELFIYEILEREVDRIIDTVLVMSPSPFIWLGTAFTPEQAVNLSVAEAEGVPIIETLIDGGTLVLEKSFIWNFIGRTSSIMPREVSWKLLKFAQAYMLKTLKLKATITDKNDLLVNEKKIVGITFGDYHGLLTSDATLNVTFNLDFADRVLTDVGKEGKDLSTWVTSLSDELHRIVPHAELVSCLKKALTKRFKVDFVEEALTDREEQVVRSGEQMREFFAL